MKKIVLTTLTVAVTAATLSAGPAFARGGDKFEQRQALKAAIAEARADRQQSGPSLFDRLFFGDRMEGKAEAKPKQ